MDFAKLNPKSFWLQKDKSECGEPQMVASDITIRNMVVKTKIRVDSTTSGRGFGNHDKGWSSYFVRVSRLFY